MTEQVDEEHCCHHSNRRKYYRRLFAAFLTLIILTLLIILIAWAILRPKNPHFTLQDATLYAFNVTTASNLLTTNFQITLSSSNPNGKSGISFKNLEIFGVYKNQQVTLATQLPNTYTGHKDATVWSPFLYGTSVPVAPYLATSLAQDQMAGTVLINLKVFGKVRWKVGSMNTKWYHLKANCPAYIPFGGKSNGYLTVGNAVKYQLLQNCNVDV